MGSTMHFQLVFQEKIKLKTLGPGLKANLFLILAGKLDATRTIWTIYSHDLFRNPMKLKGLRRLRSCQHKLLEKPCEAYLFISINSEGL